MSQFGVCFILLVRSEMKFLLCLQVTVIVGDENDNVPVFEHDSYQFSIPEHVTDDMTPPDVTSLGHVVAFDADDGANARVSYEILSGNIGAFSYSFILYVVGLSKVTWNQKYTRPFTLRTKVLSDPAERYRSAF